MDQAEFYRGWKRMEQDEPAEPLAKGMEERLLRSVRIAQRPRWQRRAPVGIIGALAMAACLLVFLDMRQPHGSLSVASDETTLGSQVASPASAALTTLTASSLLRLEIKLDDTSATPAALHAFLRRDGGARQPWDVRLVQAAPGRFALRAPLRDLGLTPGRYELVFVIGRGRELRHEVLVRADASAAPAPPAR